MPVRAARVGGAGSLTSGYRPPLGAAVGLWSWVQPVWRVLGCCKALEVTARLRGPPGVRLRKGKAPGTGWGGGRVDHQETPQSVPKGRLETGFGSEANLWVIGLPRAFI